MRLGSRHRRDLIINLEAVAFEVSLLGFHSARHNILAVRFYVRLDRVLVKRCGLERLESLDALKHPSLTAAQW